MNKSKRITVTGAGGFIGSHVVSLLLEVGYNVKALVHYNSMNHWGHLQNITDNSIKKLQIIMGDVTDSRCVYDLIEGSEIVLHLAALIGIPYSYQAPESYINTNIRGTNNVLEACRRHKTSRVVITSTSEVYGTAVYEPIDEIHPLQAQSPYSATKIAADKLAESYFRSYDLPVVTLRPFNTYGPRQSSRAVIPTILSQALSGEKEIYLGSIDPIRDLTFVEDTARAFKLAAEADDIEGETIHFGQGKAISIGELAHLCLEIVGSKATIVKEKVRERPKKSEVELLICDPTKAKKLLNWSPKVSLEEGLKRTAKYLGDNLEKFRNKEYRV
jgi:NAD dependent epimerase/dehydratase